MLAGSVGEQTGLTAVIVDSEPAVFGCIVLALGDVAVAVTVAVCTRGATAAAVQCPADPTATTADCCRPVAALSFLPGTAVAVSVLTMSVYRMPVGPILTAHTVSGAALCSRLVGNVTLILALGPSLTGSVTVPLLTEQVESLTDQVTVPLLLEQAESLTDQVTVPLLTE